MWTALSYPSKPLVAVKTPIRLAPPGETLLLPISMIQNYQCQLFLRGHTYHPPPLLKVSSTSRGSPIGEVTQSTTMNATQPAKCTTTITPSRAGNCLLRLLLKRPPMIKAMIANTVGNHWVFAALESGW